MTLNVQEINGYLEKLKNELTEEIAKLEKKSTIKETHCIIQMLSNLIMGGFNSIPHYFWRNQFL